MEMPQLNQSPVVFDAERHAYFLGDKVLKGVTSTLVRRAYPRTYEKPEGFTEEQWKKKLKQAADAGTAVHQAIELYDDLGAVSDIPELKNYISLKEDNGFVNIATEYLVSDEEHYASSIDHVWATGDGEEIILVDIKHTYEIHEPDVTCQLSVYKKFFLQQNPHLKDKNITIALLWLRNSKVEFRILKPWTDEAVDALMEADMNDQEFDINRIYGDFPVKFASMEDRIVLLETEIKEKKRQYDEMKKWLLNAMEQYGLPSFAGEKVGLSVVRPTTRESFDTTAFKQDHPKLYDEYKVYTSVKSSLRITVKK